MLDHGLVDEHLEVLLLRWDIASGPLSGLEGDLVGAAGPGGDVLAERAGHLKEGDL